MVLLLQLVFFITQFVLSILQLVPLDLTRRFELVARGFEPVTCRCELVTRGFELLTRGFELVTRNSCFTFPHCEHYTLWTLWTLLFTLCSNCWLTLKLTCRTFVFWKILLAGTLTSFSWTLTQLLLSCCKLLLSC